MEENLHNDDLEKFLNNELGGYEEAPPESVWMGVSAAVPKVVSMPVWTYKKLFWIASAAAILFLGFTIYQNIYFQKELSQLNDRIASFENNASNVPFFNEIETAPIEEESIVKKDAPIVVELQESSLINQAKRKSSARSQNIFDAKNPVAENLSQKDEVVADQNKDFSQAVEDIPLETNPKTNRNEAFALLEPIAQSKPISLAFNYDDIVIEVPVAQEEKIITPQRKDKKWFVEAEMGLFNTMLSSTLNFNFFEPNPIKKEFPVINAMAHTYAYGINVGYEITPKLSVISGLTFFQTEANEDHRVRFKRKDRMNLPNRPFRDYEYDYNYSINSGYSSGDVQISAIQVDTTTIFSDEDEFDINLSTKSVVNRVSVPIQIEYHLGGNRLRANIRAGLIAHVHQEIETELKDFESALLRKNNTRTADFRSPESFDFQIDYQFGLSIAYQINNQLELNLAPIYAATLNDLSPNPFVKTQESRIGMTSGLRFRF
ncbi:MAG: hypothetical protein AAFO07_12465 [Bacteroidota bacterium]